MTATRAGPGWLGWALRLLVLVAVIALSIRVGDYVREALMLEVTPHTEAMIHKIILLSLLAYVILMALPFVPGAEIGMTLLTLFGPSLAPVVYLATVISLALAYAAGRLIPPAATARALRGLGATRAADLIEAQDAATPEDMSAALAARLPHPWLRQLTRHRHVTLALLINLPGNIVLGGGGGLALAAGMSGLFSPLSFLLTVMIAVIPVPLMFLLMGG